MENLQKKLKRNVFKKIAASVFSFMLLFVTIFLSACANSADSNTGFDSYGNLRLVAPDIEYYEQTSGDAYNSYTGSFYVPMEYYKTTYDTTDYQNTMDRAFDQSGYRALGAAFSGKKLSEKSELVYPDYTFFVDGMVYQVHVAVDTTKLEFVVGPNANNVYEHKAGSSYYLSASEELANIFKFYYRQATSGEWLDASHFISAAYKTESGDYTIENKTTNDKKIYLRFNPILYSGSDRRNIMVKAVPNIGMNLRLGNGLTNQEKTYETQTDVIVARGESLSSTRIEYKANLYTFKLNAQNSIDLGYGDLLVDETTRRSVGNDYFYYVKDTTGDGKVNEVRGYFPNGKLITIERKFANASGSSETNYAFQSWTNTKASLNSLALEGTFKNSTLEGKYRNLENMFEVYEQDYSCIFGSKTGRDYKAFVNLNTGTTPTYVYTDAKIAEYEGGYEIVYNDTSVANSRKGTFYIVSQRDYNGTIFYANYVKVNDFTLAGSMFDADNILNDGSVELTGYSIVVYNSLNQIITKDCYNNNFTANSNNTISTYDSTTGKYTPIASNEFRLEHLSFGDYVVFSKTVQEGTVDRNYHFYGDYMTPVSFDTQNTVNVLQNRVAKDKEMIGKIVTAFNRKFYIAPSEVAFMYGGKIYYINEEGRVYNEGGEYLAGATVRYAYNVKDLTSVSVLASKYEADTSLVVNFYVYDTGSGGIIEAKEKDISYEVIKSVTTYLDDRGCVKTTVYVSVVMPSDYNIEKYNLITDNYSVDPMVFCNSNGSNNTILRFVTDLDGEYIKNYYMFSEGSVTYGDVTKSVDESFLIYGGKYYVYYYKKVDGTDTYFMYQNTENNNMLARKVTTAGSESYTLLTLKPILDTHNVSEYNEIGVTEGDDELDNPYVVYNGSCYFYADSTIKLNKFIYFLFEQHNQKNLTYTMYDKTVAQQSPNGIKSNSIANEVIYDKPKSFVQSVIQGYQYFDTANKVLLSHAGNTLSISELTLQSRQNEFFKWGWDLSLTLKYDLGSTVACGGVTSVCGAVDYALSPTNVYQGLSEFTIGDKKLYKFSHYGIIYYYYDGDNDSTWEIYSSVTGDTSASDWTIVWDGFENAKNDGVFYSCRVEKEGDKIKLTRYYTTINGNAYYYNSDKTGNIGLYTTFACSNAVDPAMLGFRSICSVKSDYSLIYFHRYHFVANSTTYYVNINNNKVYTDSKCTKEWNFNDTFVISDNGTSAYIEIVNSFTTRLLFKLGSTVSDGYKYDFNYTASNNYSLYIIDNSGKLYTISSGEYVEFERFHYDYTLTTSTLSLTVGSLNKTYVNVGGDIKSFNAICGDVSDILKDEAAVVALLASSGFSGHISDGTKAYNYTKKYFSSGSTQVSTEVYKSDMSISSFLIDDNYYYIKQAYHHDSNGKLVFDGGYDLYLDYTFNDLYKIANRRFKNTTTEDAEVRLAIPYVYISTTTPYYEGPDFSLYTVYRDAYMNINMYLNDPAQPVVKYGGYYYLAKQESITFDEYNTVEKDNLIYFPITIEGDPYYITSTADGFMELYTGVQVDNEWEFTVYAGSLDKKYFFYYDAIYSFDDSSSKRLDLKTTYTVTPGTDQLSFTVTFQTETILGIKQGVKINQVNVSEGSSGGLSAGSYKTQNSTCYVYYGVDSVTRQGERKNYTTKPIAEQNKITTVKDGGGEQVNYEVTFYYPLTNFHNLLGKSIFLGSEIEEKYRTYKTTYNPSDTYVKIIVGETSESLYDDIYCYNFYTLCGPKIISNSFYYVKPLGEKVQAYVIQEQSSDSNGQMTNYEAIYYVVNGSHTQNIDAGLITTAQETNYTARFLTNNNTIPGINELMSEELAGENGNLAKAFILTVDNYATGKYRVSYAGIQYYIKTSASTAVGSTVDIYKDAALTQRASFNAIAYQVSGTIPTQIVLNYSSFMQGSSTVQKLQSQNGQIFEMKLTNLTNEGGKPSYGNVSNIETIGLTDPSTITREYRILGDTAGQKYIDYEIPYDGAGSNNLDKHYYVKVVYTLYTCFLGADGSMQPKQSNFYVRAIPDTGVFDTSKCYYDVYSVRDNRGVEIKYISELKNSIGEPITYDMLYQSINSSSAIEQQYLYGTYLDKSAYYYYNNITNPSDPDNHFYFIYSDGKYYKYEYSNGDKAGSLNEDTSVDESKLFVKDSFVDLNYTFYHNGSFYYTDYYIDESGNEHHDVYKHSSNIGLGTNYNLLHTQITAGTKLSGYLYYPSTKTIYKDGGSTVFARISTDISPRVKVYNPDMTFVDLAAVMMAYDKLSRAVYFYDKVNTVLYKNVFFNETSTTYTFDNATVVDEFTYAYYNTIEKFDFRPSVKYFVLSNFELTTIVTETIDGEGKTTRVEEAYQYPVFAKYLLSNTEVPIVSSNVVSKTVTKHVFHACYFSDGPYRNKYLYKPAAGGGYEYVLYDTEFYGVNLSGTGITYYYGDLGAVGLYAISNISTVDDYIVSKNVEVEYLIKSTTVEVGNASRYVKIENSTEIATILGKYTIDNVTGEVIIGNTFSSLLTATKPGLITDDTYDPIKYLDQEKLYYSVDYTNQANATEGFPGVTLVDGMPYMNPIFVFDVYHTQGTLAAVDLAIGVNSGYYVEIINGLVEHANVSSITDFSSVTFKHTLANLDAGAALDSMYYIVDSTTFKTLKGYRLYKDASPSTITTFYNYYYNTDSDRDTKFFMNMAEYMKLNEEEKSVYRGFIKYGSNYYKYVTESIKLADCAMNEDDINVYFADSTFVTPDGAVIYNDNIFVQKSGAFVALNENMAAIWETSVFKMEDIPYYDIHTYHQDENGKIYATSDLVDGAASSLCNGLEELDTEIISSKSDVDFSNVIIGGLTTAYKVPYNAVLQYGASYLEGYWLETAIQIYNEELESEKPVYLETGKDAVVLFANPLINFDGEIFYKFKEWRVYTRDSAEYIVFNQGATNGLGDDRLSAICRFRSLGSGYYLFLPVYERVYALSLGTAVDGGAANIGGSVSIQSTEASASIDETDHTEDLFTYQYLTDRYKDTYFRTFLLYTGEQIGSAPVFVKTGIAEDYLTNSEAISIIVIPNYEPYFTVYVYKGTTLETTFKTRQNDNFAATAGTPYLVSPKFVAGIYNVDVDAMNDSVFYTDEVFSKTKTLISGKLSTAYAEGFYYTGLNSGYTIIDFMTYVIGTHNASSSRHNYATIYNNYLYTIPTTPANSISSMLIDGAKFAKVIVREFNFITKNEDSNVSGFYYNTNNDLTSGEFYYAADGKTINSTIQYKTNYYERDSKIKLIAQPDSGYRLEGWYLAQFDETLGWVISDEKVTEMYSASYLNELVKTEFESSNTSAQTFKIATTGLYPNGVAQTRTYTITNQYMDEFNIVFASDNSVVPYDIKDSYCGLFANLGSSRTNPRFVRLYMKNNNRSDLYYDEEYCLPVSAKDFATGSTNNSIDKLWEQYYIGYINFHDAVNASYQYDGTKIMEDWSTISGGRKVSNYTRYTFDDREVYAVYKYNKSTLSYDVTYYRNKVASNYEVEEPIDNPNVLTIHNLHSNARLVAKFTETYQAYIFSEDEEDSGISVEALYYYNRDDSKDVIRTNASGSSKTKDDDALVGGNYSDNYFGASHKETSGFYQFYIQKEEDVEEGQRRLTIFDGYNNSGTWSQDTSYFQKYYTPESIKNFAELSKINPGVHYYKQSDGHGGYTDVQKLANPLTELGSFERNAYGMFKTETQGLALKNYYFDVNTTLFLLVRVEVGNMLSVHSLGLDQKYELNFLVEPDMDLVNKAKDDKLKYVYYVLKVTFNNNLEQTNGITTTEGNENPEYVLHPDKARSVSNSILSGSALTYYDSYYDIYASYNASTVATANTSISSTNYLTFKIGGTSVPIKIAFNTNYSYVHSRAFSFSRTMAEQVFFYLLQDGNNSTFTNYISAPATLLTAGPNGNGKIKIGTTGQKEFDFADYIKPDDNKPIIGADAMRNYFIFVFQNICYEQKSGSAEKNFRTALDKLDYYLDFVLGNNDHLTKKSIYDLNYYTTVSGDVYVNDKLIERLLALKLNGRTLESTLTEYTVTVLISLEDSIFESLGDFVSAFNQIIYAATYNENTIVLNNVLYSSTYYNSAYSTYYQTKYGISVPSYENYAKSLNTNGMSSITEIFVQSVKELYRYSLSESNEAQTTTCGANYIAGKIYKYGMPQIAGKMNYINLSSLKIYTISVSTSIVDSYSQTMDYTKTNPEDGTYVFTDTTNFKSNPYYALDDTIYVSGGVTTSSGTLNYIGDAWETKLGANDVITYVPGYEKTQSFNRKYNHIEGQNELYEKDSKNKTNYSSYGDALFVENSIILWGGLKAKYKKNNATDISENSYSRAMLNNSTIKENTGGSGDNRSFTEALYKTIENGKYFVTYYSSTTVNDYDNSNPNNQKYYIYSEDFKSVYIATLTVKDGVDFANAGFSTKYSFSDFVITSAYTFAGWYSQTYDENTGLWSEFVNVSGTFTRPFVTTATSNTNITALFVAMTNLTFTYKTDEVSVTFTDPLDSRGQEIKVVEDPITKVSTLSGWFYFNYDPIIGIAPTGGYRLADDFGLTIFDGASSTSSNKLYDKTLTYYQSMNADEELEEKLFEDVSLTSAMYVRYSLLDICATDKKAKVSCDINMKTTHVVFTTFKVEGYEKTLANGSKEIDTIVTIYSALAAENNKVFFCSSHNGAIYVGKDSAHNELFVVNGTTLTVYGYFDYEKYNGNILTSIAYKQTPDVNDEKFEAWFTNDIDEKTGISTKSTDKKINELGLNLGTYSTSSMISLRMYFWYPETNNDGTAITYEGTKGSEFNSTCNLDPTNHFILFTAKRQSRNILTVKQEFYEVNNSGTGFIQSTDQFMVVPMTIWYNTTIYPSLTAPSNDSNGHVFFDYRPSDPTKSGLNATEALARSKDYYFSNVKMGQDYLTVSVGSEYDIVYDGLRYYKFVGFYSRIGTTDTLLTTNMSYTYESDPPAGTIVAKYIRISTIEITTTTGGSVNTSVSSSAFTTEYNSYKKMQFASHVSVFNITVNGSAIETMVIDTTSSLINNINYVIYNTKVEVTPVATSGYEITKKQFALIGQTIAIPSVGDVTARYNFNSLVPLDSYGVEYEVDVNQTYFKNYLTNKQISFTGNTFKINKYNQGQINFSFEFTSAYIATIKQYNMTSLSSSAISTLFTGGVYAIIGTEEINLDDITSSDYFAYNSANIMDKMTANVPQNEELYIYYFAQLSYSVIGLYSNGTKIATADELISRSLSIMYNGSLLSGTTHTIGGVEYLVYAIKYKEANRSALSSNVSLEIRYTTASKVKTVIDGIEPNDILNNSYENIYGTIFEDSMKVVDGTNKSYLIASTVAENQYVPVETNETNTITLNSGSGLKYNISVKENSNYSFIYYYYYKKYEATDLRNNWYEFMYNGSTFYYYNDGSDVAYYAQSLDSEEFYLDVKFREKTDLDDRNYILIEEVITSAPQASIAIGTAMVDNADIDENGESVITIYAKFAQVVTVRIYKSVGDVNNNFVHADDSTYYTQHYRDFMAYFDAKVVYIGPSGQEEVQYIYTSKLGSNGYYFEDITITKLSTVKIYPIVADALSNRYISTDYITVFNSFSGAPISGFTVKTTKDGSGNDVPYFVIDTSTKELKACSNLFTTLNYYASYTLTLEKNIDGKTRDNTDDVDDSVRDLLPFINVSSDASYRGVYYDNQYFINDLNYLSYFNHSSIGEVNNETVPMINYHNADSVALTYPISKKLSGEEQYYTNQILTTSVALNEKEEELGLVFYGWYINGYLYSTARTIQLPLNGLSTVGSSYGFVLLYKKDANSTNTTRTQDANRVVGLYPLLATTTGDLRYYFDIDGNGNYVYIDQGEDFANFKGHITANLADLGYGDYGYEYVSTDNLKVVASYGFYTKINYDTNVHYNDDLLTSAIISGNLLRFDAINENVVYTRVPIGTKYDSTVSYYEYDEISCSYIPYEKYHEDWNENDELKDTIILCTKNAGVQTATNGSHIVDTATAFNTLIASKQDTEKENSQFITNLSEYSLTNTLNSYTITSNLDEDALYAQGVTNLLITGGHIIGYRIKYFKYTRIPINITATGAKEDESTLQQLLDSYTYEFGDGKDGGSDYKQFSLSLISNNNEMGYMSLNVGEIMSSARITAYYERVYEISTFTSTIGDYDDNTSKVTQSDPSYKTGGTISVYGFQSNNPTSINDGTYYTDIYDSVAITCVPYRDSNIQYILAGIFINGEYLGIDNLGFDTYNYNCEEEPLRINLRRLFLGRDTEQEISIETYGKDITIEARFVSLITFTVRLSVANTNLKSALYSSYVMTKDNGPDVNAKFSTIYSNLVYGAAGSLNSLKNINYILLEPGTEFVDTMTYYTYNSSTGEYEVYSRNNADWDGNDKLTRANYLYKRIGQYENATRSIWDDTEACTFAVVVPGTKYNSKLAYYVYDESTGAYSSYVNDPADWDADNCYIGSRQLFASEYLLMEFSVAYGTYIELCVTKDSYINQTAGFNFAFNGWYLFRQNQFSKSNSVVTYDTCLGFYATKDFYGSSLDFVAKYEVRKDDYSITTQKLYEVVSEDKSIELKKEDIEADTAFGKTTNMFTHVQSGKEFLFTGWWQIVNDSTRPATYLLVTNKYYDDLPNVTNLVARFVEMKDIVIDLPYDISRYGYGVQTYSVNKTTYNSRTIFRERIEYEAIPLNTEFNPDETYYIYNSEYGVYLKYTISGNEETDWVEGRLAKENYLFKAIRTGEYINSNFPGKILDITSMTLTQDIIDITGYTDFDYSPKIDEGTIVISYNKTYINAVYNNLVEFTLTEFIDPTTGIITYKYFNGNYPEANIDIESGTLYNDILSILNFADMKYVISDDNNVI